MKPLTKEDFLKVKTKGQFKQLIDRILKEIKKGAVSKSIVSSLINQIPVLGNASNIYDVLKSFSLNQPDDQRPNNVLGRIDIDDDIEKIIDKDVMLKFLKFLSLSISEDDSTSLSNFNINVELQKYLSDSHNNRTISGFNESILRKYISLVIR